MKQKIYLHPGYPKTGTTTLQTYVLPQVTQMLSGMYFGKQYDIDGTDITPVKIDQFRKMVNEIDLTEFNNKKDEIWQQYKFINGLTLIVSDEGYLSEAIKYKVTGNKLKTTNAFTTAEKMHALFGKHAGFDPHILITIRRQDSLLPSLYAQAYAHFFRRIPELFDFTHFLDELFNEKSKYNHIFLPLNYDIVVDKYCELFGKENVTVIPYELMKSDKSEFLYHLSSFFQIDLEQIPLGESNIRNSKQGWRSQSLTINDWIKTFKGSKYFRSILPKAVRINMQNQLNKFKAMKPRFIHITPNQKKSIWEVFQDSNRRLADHCEIDLSRWHYY